VEFSKKCRDDVLLRDHPYVRTDVDLRIDVVLYDVVPVWLECIHGAQRLLD
jgi:hypothetical protein